MYSQCPECHARFRVSCRATSVRAAASCDAGAAEVHSMRSSRSATPCRPRSATRRGRLRADDTTAPATSRESVAGVEFHFTADDIESVSSSRAAGRVAPQRVSQDIEADGPEVAGAEPPVVVEYRGRALRGHHARGRAHQHRVHPRHRDRRRRAPTGEFEVLHEVPDVGVCPTDDHSQVSARIDASSIRDVATVRARDRIAECRQRPVSKPAPAPGSARLDCAGRRGAVAAHAAGDALAERTFAVRGPRGGTDAGTLDAALSLAWSAGCLLVALALLAQVTHQFRQDLVRHPQVGPLLKDLYARLGLSAVAQLGPGGPSSCGSGATAAVPTRTVALPCARVSRIAPSFAQPHPILRLELDDRFGDAVAIRDFEPAEYLKSPSPTARDCSAPAPARTPSS